MKILDKKKVLIIKGSARSDGFSNRLCREVEEVFNGYEVDVFDTYKENFLPCNGCNYCEKNGKCVKEDLDVFFNKFENYLRLNIKVKPKPITPITFSIVTHNFAIGS